MARRTSDISSTLANVAHDARNAAQRHFNQIHTAVHSRRKLHVD
ncbi:hypothetical protein BN2497_10311 [Janthinobacterium sp. CG23_2]|nr:hypothetical protein BN2497_10311 [Janthinobacterium sp. CG23_2]CUU31553.1 hypothetical protein BN3177_10311 [Janthinobacterium sp. CG23_2]